MNVNICIVSKEYRWVELEAPTKESALAQAWALVDLGFTTNKQADDRETEVFIEQIGE